MSRLQFTTGRLRPGFELELDCRLCDAPRVAAGFAHISHNMDDVQHRVMRKWFCTPAATAGQLAALSDRQDATEH